MTRCKLNQDLADFGAGVFLKEVLARDQVRALGVGPDIMPSRTDNVGGEYLVFPSPNDGRPYIKFTDPGFKPFEAFSGNIGARINGDRAGPLPGQSPVVRVWQNRFVSLQRICPAALAVDYREVDAAPRKSAPARQNVRPDDWRMHQPPRQDLAVEFRGGCPPCPGRHDGHRGGSLSPGEQRRQAGRAAPVVADEENAVEVELVNQCHEIGRVVVQAVRTRAVRMLRQAKTNLVRHDYPITCPEQRRNGVAPQVTPGGIAVQQQHGRSVSRSLVDVVHPPAVDVGEL